MVNGSGDSSPIDDVFVSRELASPTRPHLFPAGDLNSQRRYDRTPFTSSPARRGSPLNPDRNSPNDRIRGSAKHRLVSISPTTPSSHSTSNHMPSRLADDNDWEGSSFSNEYDLSHEDPRILQEVQRAIKLKARREARAKRGSTISPSTSLIHPSSPSSPLSSTELTSNAQTSRLSTSPVNGSEASPNASSSASAEEHHISNSSPNHPVPTSLDGGMTLDWGSSPAGEERHERRWPLTHRRKEKDKFTPLASMSDHQELMHAEKLARLRGVITPLTARNASLAKEQLTRRYALIYASSSSPSFNLLKASRWYRSQDSDVRDSLEKAEPMTWLGNRDKRAGKRKNIPWNMSSLIMEEFVHSQIHRGTEYSPLLSNETSPSRRLTGSNNRSSPSHSLEQVRRIEPLPVALVHTKVESESRKSAESGISSLRSGASHRVSASLSPTSTRSRARELGIPHYRIPGHDTDISSIRNSLSDQSDAELLYSAEKPRDISGKPAISATPLRPVAVDKSRGATPSNLLGYSPSKEFIFLNTISLDKSSGRRSLASVDQVLEDRMFGESHAESDYQSFENQRSKEEEEEELRRQYQIKLTLLEEAMTHNQRVRQVLNRVSVGIRVLESTQRTAEKLIGIPHTKLPQELLEAFGHDPAAVTGATRNLQGWRAVEDIHRRLIRQRAVFREFLQNSDNVPSVKSVLDDPISNLVHNLKMLENCKDQVAMKTKDIGEMLKNVQTTHSEVKLTYNNTLANTSLVYPELSQIVALEESYRDQYQQFWEFGMDALTFLLDTVTPVWRTYGKRIGEDVRDFLIIPLYRNEFTGEARRYPIMDFPRRSFRHWLGLLLFSFGSIAIVVLQARAALSSTVNYRLQWIPYEEMRWILLPLFWTGIVLQWFAVVMESLVVFMQVGIVFWWVGWLIGLFT